MRETFFVQVELLLREIKMKKDDAFELVLFIGMLESTHAEGYIDENRS